MAFAPVQIINMALARIGAAPIISLSDASVEAQSAANLYEVSRQSVLRSFPWRFAIKVQELSQVDIETFNWGFAYAMPHDLLRAIRPQSTSLDKPIDFEVIGNELYANIEPLSLKYIYDCQDTSLFDATFVTALSCYLAAELAMPITGSMDAAAYNRDQFLGAMRVAQAASASEGSSNGKDRLSIRKSRG
jgi:hypothetical protein